MKEIKTIEKAIKLLTERRGFKIEDLREAKYRIYDEDISFIVETDKELINYANEQRQEELY